MLGSLALIEEEAGGDALILTGDRDLFQCATKKVNVLLLGGRGKSGPAADRPGRGEAPVRDPARARARLHRPARRSVGRPPRRQGHRREAGGGDPRPQGSLEVALEGAAEDGPLGRDQDLLRSFRDIATLRPVKLKRPKDAETDRAGGAKAAKELGMNRLAERLSG